MSIARSIRHFFQNIRRTLAYLPIIWKDNDHDYASLLIVMEFKLNRLADHIEDHDIYTTAKRDADRIRKAVDHLRKGYLDDDISEEHSALLGLWWNLCSFEEKLDGTVELTWPKDNVDYQELSRKLNEIRDSQQATKEHHRKEFHRMFKKYITQWWC